MSRVTLHHGDNREHLRRLIDEGVRVHSVVTDPPYGLVSVQKRFGGEGAVPVGTANNDGSFARLTGGFMGKAWDGTGIERDPEFWRLIWEILLPGGYCFAFSGSRTGHWQACAMELAGFIMHPMHGWVYGSGFPKAHNASKAIDKMLGAEFDTVPASGVGFMNADGRGGYNPTINRLVQTSETSPEAAQWEGWAYGTQAQKPALEPIYIGQKPFSEKTGAANLLKHGVGAVNIDGCRVPGVKDTPASPRRAAQNETYGDLSNDPGTGSGWDPNTGRHPANLLHDGSDEVVALFPESKGQLAAVGPQHGSRETVHAYGNYGPRPDTLPRGDSGSAARFFHAFPPDTDPIIYNSKAGKADRAGSKHPTVKPVALMQYLIRHITPPGGTVLDPFAGSGTTAEAAMREGFDCILMEQEDEYAEFLRSRFASVLTTDTPEQEDIFG